MKMALFNEKKFLNNFASYSRSNNYMSTKKEITLIINNISALVFIQASSFIQAMA